MKQVTNFQKEVIEGSYSLPVVVDFWATWCAPCRILEPIMEELSQTANGRWVLAKIDVDDNQDLLLQYGIVGIPAVKMFYKGDIIGEFAGVLPKHVIHKWLEEYLPDERRLEIENIKDELLGDNQLAAVSRLESFVTINPEIEETRVMLAKAKVFSEPAYARELIKDVLLGTIYYNLAQHIRNLADLMECNYSHEDTPVLQKIKAAQIAIEDNNYEAAIDFIIQAVKINKEFEKELPKRAGISFFHFLGEEHEITRKYKGTFTMAYAEHQRKVHEG